jgi:hypothetical protein
MRNLPNEMAKLDSETLKRFGANGRKKVELEFNKLVVITKYIEALTTLKKES